MKRYAFPLVFSVIFSLFVAFTASAQTSTFEDKNVEYTFELPDAKWKMIVKPSAASPNVEYVYGARSDGHLDIRKFSVRADEMLSDLILREQENRLQFKPGFVPGREENFAGILKGRVFNHEFTQSGKNMSGRFYFLRSDATTVYVLRFTGLRGELLSIRNQIDSIARSFQIKPV
jgi:hypothetical protein